MEPGKKDTEAAVEMETIFATESKSKLSAADKFRVRLAEY